MSKCYASKWHGKKIEQQQHEWDGMNGVCIHTRTRSNANEKMRGNWENKNTHKHLMKVKIRTKKKVLYKVKSTNKYVWETMSSPIHNTIINKSKANYRATARQTTEQKKIAIRCVYNFIEKVRLHYDGREKRDKKRLNEWMNEWKYY